MVKATVNFIGVPADVDCSILKMKFDRGFLVETMTREEETELIANLENLPVYEVAKSLFVFLHCMDPSDDKLYVVRNAFDAETETDG